jgi:hypothetical protein
MAITPEGHSRTSPRLAEPHRRRDSSPSSC